jgi:hypothetical protein
MKIDFDNFENLAYNRISSKSVDVYEEYEKSFYTEKKDYFDESKLKVDEVLSMLDDDEYEEACKLPKEEREKLAEELMCIISEQVEVCRQEEEEEWAYYRKYGNGY